MRMQVATAVAAWAVTSACQSLPITRNLWSRDADYKDLSEKLSVSAKVYYPGSDEFEQASTRWSNLEKPTVNIVVVPGTENDVVETVSFASYTFLIYLSFSPSVSHLSFVTRHVLPTHGPCILIPPTVH